MMNVAQHQHGPGQADSLNRSGRRWRWSLLFAIVIVAIHALAAPPLTVNAAEEGREIVNALSAKCLDVVNASTADGANVQQYYCHGGANQRWRFHRRYIEHDNGTRTYYYLIVNVKSGKCLEVFGASGPEYLGNVQQSSCHGGNNQRWSLSLLRNDDGVRYYAFLNWRTSGCMDLAESSYANGVNVWQYRCDFDNIRQQWRLNPEPLGTV